MINSLFPPAQKGDIYVVINHKEGSNFMNNSVEDTKVSVSWGAYHKSEVRKVPKQTDQLYSIKNFGHVARRWAEKNRFEPGVPYKGFVLHIEHKKNDSVLLTVSTDGKIIKGPYQGSIPPE